MIKNMRLEGKIALITGGSRGIGRAIGLGMAREGADVAIAFRVNEMAANEVVRTVRSMGRRALCMQADVSRVEDIRLMVEGVCSEFDRIDILVNNAGIGILGSCLDTSEEQWNRVIDTNLKGVFFCAQAVARKMIRQKSGKIINMSSVNGIVAEANQCSYNASKGGVQMITRSLAIELAPFNIQVNALGPGFILTEASKDDIADPETREEYLKNIPLGRFGVPKDVVGAAVFLASNESDYFTGQTLYMDGGIMVQQVRRSG
jgi:3-oxoacyl-[acyl-carrier protein] reductase